MKTKDNKSIQLNDKNPLLQQLLNSEVSNPYANFKVLKGNMTYLHQEASSNQIREGGAQQRIILRTQRPWVRTSLPQIFFTRIFQLKSEKLLIQQSMRQIKPKYRNEEFGNMLKKAVLLEQVYVVLAVEITKGCSKERTMMNSQILKSFYHN